MRRLTAAMQAMETVGPIGPIEVPTPAHAVRLRRPVCLTATYVVACTALLVSVSLLPFGSGATAPVANARGDRERAGPVVEHPLDRPCGSDIQSLIFDTGRYRICMRESSIFDASELICSAHFAIM